MNETRYTDGALLVDRCPHCRIANPLLNAIHRFDTDSSSRNNARRWVVYACSTCGSAVLGASKAVSSTSGPGLVNGLIIDVIPKQQLVDKDIPAKAAAFLRQAVDSLHSPSGAIMLCASSVDAMLKEKGYKTGTLNARIDKAAANGVITKEMAQWAHDIRLDANDERHADAAATLPTEKDAGKCIAFVRALAMFTFVLPAMVERGRADATKAKPESE